MGPSQDSDVREGFLELYRELFSHVSYLEVVIERLVHGQHVERAMLENHLAQMIASIAVSQKKYTKPRTVKRVRKDHPDYFRNEMLRVSKVIKGQFRSFENLFLGGQPGSGGRLPANPKRCDG